MSDTKRDGLERVRHFLLSACAEKGIVTATAEEIGRATDMSKQMAARHVKTLLEIGVMQKLRQSVYVAASPASNFTSEVDTGLTRSLHRVDKEFTKHSPEPAQVDTGLTRSLHRVDKEFTNFPKNKNNTKEEEKEKKEEKENSEKIIFGKVFYPGLSLGNGIFLEGVPDATGTEDCPTRELDRRIDWNHPVILSIEENIKSIFNTKEKRWSPNLTKYLIAGVVYGMRGFQRVELLAQARYVSQSLAKRRQTEKLISDEKCFHFKDNEFPKRGWFVVFAYVRDWFKEHGIRAMPCEKTDKQKRAEAARLAKSTPLFDLLESATATQTTIREISPTGACRESIAPKKSLEQQLRELRAKKRGESRDPPPPTKGESNSITEVIERLFSLPDGIK